ncbi:MAG: hypothetical protein IKK93_06905 [Campylobacter sp.]|nr:hypothetical protein [Campylobacter sp.]
MINIMPAIISTNAAISLMNMARLSEIKNNEELEEEVLEALSKDIPIELEVDFDSDDESIEVSDAQGEFLDEETFNKIVENAKNVGLITEDKYEDIHYKWRRKGKPHFSIMFEFTEEDNGK